MPDASAPENPSTDTFTFGAWPRLTSWWGIVVVRLNLFGRMSQSEDLHG